MAELAESTVKDNSRLFANPDDVPRYALTMGIADIMDARKILILACGANKLVQYDGNVGMPLRLRRRAVA